MVLIIGMAVQCTAIVSQAETLQEVADHNTKVETILAQMRK